jgi:hypothetical protein
MKNVAGQHFVFISCSGSLLIHYDYVENFINIFLYRWLGVNKNSTKIILQAAVLSSGISQGQLGSHVFDQQSILSGELKKNPEGTTRKQF